MTKSAKGGRLAETAEKADLDCVRQLGLVVWLSHLELLKRQKKMG